MIIMASSFIISMVLEFAIARITTKFVIGKKERGNLVISMVLQLVISAYRQND